MESIPFKEIVESARVGVWVIDADYRTQFINPTMGAMLGIKVEKALGKQLSFLLPPAFVQKIFSCLDEKNVQETYFERQNLLNKQGRMLSVNVLISPLKVAGQPRAWLMAFSEQSSQMVQLIPAVLTNQLPEQPTSQNALSASPELMGAIFEQSHEWKILLEQDLEGQLNITDSNLKGKAFFLRFGIAWPENGLANMPISTLLADFLQMPKALVAQRIAQYKRVLRTQTVEVVSSDKPLRIAPNYYYEETITPISQPDGTCNVVLISVRDITQEVATSNALISSEEKFKTLFDQSTIGECEFHKYSTQLSFNHSAREIFQIPDEISRIDISPSVFANNLLPGGLEQVLNTKSVIRLETEFSPSYYRDRYQFPTLLQNNIFLDIAIVPIEAAKEGLPLAFLVQMRDITEKVKSERALQKAFDELKQLRSQLEQENYYLRAEAALGSDFGDIIFSGNKLKEVLSEVQQVASTDATVLILGETGTGKELVAKAIHNISPRKARPLIKLNCAALPKELIESELFGHEKGAFTGAINRKIGRFELADGGTIFLDEIGEMPLELQPKLLRVLQEGEFERVGGTDTKKINVRVVAATNRDLEAELKLGNFRPDLYYRLNVFPVNMPPLRERPEDIPALVWFFVKKFNKKFQKNIDKIPERLIQWMQLYQWPGNVRELENLVERAMILAKTNTLNTDAFPLASELEGELPNQPAQNLKQVKRRHILQTLERHRWVINGELGAAKALGLKPSTLRDQMRKLDIKRPSKAQ